MRCNCEKCNGAMSRRTEAWWVCSKCKGAITEISVRCVRESILKHRKLCDPILYYQIKRLPQETRREI